MRERLPRKTKKAFYKYVISFQNKQRESLNREIDFWDLDIPKLKPLKRWNMKEMMKAGEVSELLQAHRLAPLYRAAEEYGRQREAKRMSEGREDDPG